MRKKKDFWDIADEVVKASHVDSIEDITIQLKPIVGTITGSTTSSSVNYFWSPNHTTYTTVYPNFDSRTVYINGVDIRNLCWDFSDYK